MSKRLSTRKLHPKTRGLLQLLKGYALSVGYPEPRAECVAVQALDRLQQGGMQAFVQQIKRIIRRTATGGQWSYRDYKKLAQGPIDYANYYADCIPHYNGTKMGAHDGIKTIEICTPYLGSYLGKINRKNHVTCAFLHEKLLEKVEDQASRGWNQGEFTTRNGNYSWKIIEEQPPTKGSKDGRA